MVLFGCSVWRKDCEGPRGSGGFPQGENRAVVTSNRILRDFESGATVLTVWGRGMREREGEKPQRFPVGFRRS